MLISLLEINAVLQISLLLFEINQRCRFSHSSNSNQRQPAAAPNISSSVVIVQVQPS